MRGRGIAMDVSSFGATQARVTGASTSLTGRCAFTYDVPGLTGCDSNLRPEGKHASPGQDRDHHRRRTDSG